MSYDPGLIGAGIAGIAALVAIAWLARAAWTAVMNQNHLDLMARMLARQGVEIPAESTLAAEAGGRAVLRCTMCSETARCERFLATDDKEGFEAFCPNAGFIRAVRRGIFFAPHAH